MKKAKNNKKENFDDCDDCPICKLMKEGRGGNMEELINAFAEAEKMGAVVGFAKEMKPKPKTVAINKKDLY